MHRTQITSIKTAAALLVMASSLSLPRARAGRPRQAGTTRRAGAPAPARPEVGGGHIPARGPARAPARKPEAAPAKQATPNYAHATGHPNAPHVDVKNDRWVGHDTRAGEAGLRLDHPWAHGHFGGVFGPTHVYRLGGEATRALGSTVPSSVSRPSTTAIRATGCGTATTSCSTMIQTTLGTTSRTTCGLGRTCMLSTSESRELRFAAGCGTSIRCGLRDFDSLRPAGLRFAAACGTSTRCGLRDA